jgi:hypothetical protein
MESAAPVAPASPRSNANRFLIAGFTLLLLILIILWYTAPQWEGPLGLGPNRPPPAQSFASINITQWTFSGPTSCWQGSVFSFGGTVAVGGTFQVSVSLPYPGGLVGPNCTARSVTLLTTGFTLLNSNAPLTVAPGDAGRLFANVTVPETAYAGPLSVSVAVGSP